MIKKYNLDTAFKKFLQGRVVIILIGNSGCGKGTLLSAIERELKKLFQPSRWQKIKTWLCSLLKIKSKEKKNYLISETGNLLRIETPFFSPLFKKIAQEKRDAGQLLPYPVSMSMWTSLILYDYQSGPIIMDGSPRSVEEVNGVLEFFEFFGFQRVFVELKVSKEICKQRILKRSEEDIQAGIKPRADSVDEEIISTKLDYFDTSVIPAIKLLKSKKEKIITIEADTLSKREVESIFFAELAKLY